MYLSRIELDLKNRQTIKALSSPQVMHAAVEEYFPGAPRPVTERKLWRLDYLAERSYLLLLSRNKPDFAGFARQFCPPGQQAEIRDYQTLLKRLENGQVWGFRLRANPAHSVPGGAADSGRGKVYAHVTVAQQQSWLCKKSAGCGFVLREENNDETFEVTQRELVRFQRGGQDGNAGYRDL